MNALKHRENPFELDSRYATTRRLYNSPPQINNALDIEIACGLLAQSNADGMTDGGLRKRGFFKLGIAGLPLISVVTVVYNGDNYLEQTVNSVIKQTYKNIEFIIIDGGSNDNSLNIIRRYEDMIDYWLSEADTGIAEAMNKGLRFAMGEYIVFIHADDYFSHAGIIEEAIKQIGDEDISMFDLLFGARLKRLNPRGFNFWLNFKICVSHQAILCRQSVFERIGGFDTDFKITMDYDLLLRAYHNGMTACRHPLVLSVMRDTGISSRQDWPSLVERLAEEKKVHLKNCRSRKMKWLYNVYWFLYIPYRKIMKI